MARVYNRKEESVKFIAGTQVTAELSRNYHVMEYILELELECENGANAVYFDDNLFRAITNLSVVANGSLNIKQVPGEKLVYNGLFDYSRPFKSSITKTANGTFIQKQTAVISMITPNAVRPHDTILLTNVFDTLYLNVVWGDGSKLGNDITIKSGKINVSSTQMIGYKRAEGEKIAYNKEVARFEAVKANATNYLIKLDVNQAYRGFMLAVEKITSGARTRTNSVVKNVRLKSGTVVFMDLSWDTMQRINENDFKLNSDVDNTGLVYLDFTPRGFLTDMLNTVQSNGGFNTLELELEITNLGANDMAEIYVFSDYIEFTNQTEVA